LDALALLDTLAATASFDQISLINSSALSNHWLIGLTDIVGLVGQIISHVGWPTGFVDRVGCNSLINFGGLVGLLTLADCWIVSSLSDLGLISALWVF
jgi:hypothetical protein